jgi:hypothetical protein
MGNLSEEKIFMALAIEFESFPEDVYLFILHLMPKYFSFFLMVFAFVIVLRHFANGIGAESITFTLNSHEFCKYEEISSKDCFCFSIQSGAEFLLFCLFDDKHCQCLYLWRYSSVKRRRNGRKNSHIMV